LALGAVLVVLAWQWAAVNANYGGNWTALFCTGSKEKHPPLDASEHVYLFVGSTGYDGQFYHYIAHDPFLRSDVKNYVDDPRLRYRRILIPLLAYGLALGSPAAIDRAYELVCLLTIGLGVYWSCRFAQNTGLAAAWGLLFLAIPATPVTMDRLVIDGGLAALTAAFICYCPSPSWKLFAVLACAVLARETGFLLVLAYSASLAWRREFRMAGIFLLSAAPAIAWFAYVQTQTVAKSYATSLVPCSAIVAALRHPPGYPPGTPFLNAVVAADYLALTGAVLAFALAILWFLRGPSDPVRIAALLFAILGLALQRPDLWQNVYNFGRLYAPLFVCLSGLAATSRNPWLLAPVAMMLPRIAIQLAPQALGIIHWIA
jgi:hypothetical protein